MLNLKNKTYIKLISLVLIQVFLLTGVVYPESNNKNISSLYIQAKSLRVPMMGADKQGRLEKAIKSSPFLASDEKGSPLNLAKYLIAHKNYRGNPISIEDLRKVRINQETGWSYVDSTIYLEINSLKEIGVLESVDRGTYALSEEFTMDQIMFIHNEVMKIINKNDPEGRPLGLDRYRLDDLSDEEIEAMRAVVMNVINNIGENKKAFREGELFYLGDNTADLGRLMPLAEAVEKSLDSINDRDLDAKGVEDKKILKRGLSIAPGYYSPKHPQERHLDIIIKDDLGRDVAKIKVWPLKLRNGLTFSKKAVFLEWLGIDMGWMKGKGVVGQAIYSELSKLLYELGYREIYGHRNQGSEGFWKRMGWKPADVNIYIPGTPGFYIEKPDSVKGHCPSIVDLYKGNIGPQKIKLIEPQLPLASNQSIRPMSRRTLLSKSAKAVAGAAVLTAAGGVTVYKLGEPSKEEKQEAAYLRKPLHEERYDSKEQFEIEKGTFIAARNTRDNLLGQDDTRRVKDFLTPVRIRAIQLAAEKWKIEPALVAGFLYEEDVHKDSQNKTKERIKRMFGLELTTGLADVDMSFIRHGEFLDFLYDNKDFIMNQLLEKKEDKNMFRDFINGHKGTDPQEDFEGYESIRQITEKGDVRKAWLETIYPLLDGLAKDVEPINILLGAYAMRIKSREIAARNKRETRLPEISVMKEDSNVWMVGDYQEIPSSLQERYSIFNSRYYPPYAYHYFLAVSYTGIEKNKERAIAKVNAYIMFEKSATLKIADTAQHASWAYVEKLSPENYDESKLMLDKNILVEEELISEMRATGRHLKPGSTFGLRGNRFILKEANGQKVLISKDIIDAFTEGEAMAILADALSKTRFMNPDPELPLVISSLYKSPRLFEDCKKNGFIGINQALLKLYNKYKDNPEIKQYLKVLLQTGLEHEIRHEAGMTDEAELKAIDARTIVKLCNENNIYPEDIKAFLKKENIIDEDFVTLLYFYSGVENSLAELRERWRSDPGSFMVKESGQQSVDRILGFMRKDPGCFVGFGDMSKIGVMNYALTREIVDKLIPIMANAANLVVSKYKGAAVSVTGDEVCLVLPSSLRWRDVNEIRLELQAVLAYFLEDAYMFCKVKTEDNEAITYLNDILGSDGFTGIYEDKDGYFVLFPKRALSEVSDFLKLKPLDMPSPRLNFGIVKASGESEDVHANYGVSMKHSEYVLNVSKGAGFHGATADTLGDKDRFTEESESSTIPRLTLEERKKIADEYASRGMMLYIDQIEEYYPAVKREYLYYVLKSITSAQIGTMVLIRGPPDNFYIVKKIDSNTVAFMKLEFLYEPEGNLKNMVDRTIAEGIFTRDSLRSKRWLGAYGFKVINEFHGHQTANRVILEETKFLNKLLGDNFNFAALNESVMDGLQSILSNLGVEAKPRTILSSMRLDAREVNIERIGEIDDIGKMREDIFTIEKKSGNILRLFNKERRREFEKLRAKERIKERRKFSYILKQAYSEPPLNASDFSALQKNNLWQTQTLEGVMPLENIRNRVCVIGHTNGDLGAYREILEGLGLIKIGDKKDGSEDRWIGEEGVIVVQASKVIKPKGPGKSEELKARLFYAYSFSIREKARGAGGDIVKVYDPKGAKLSYYLRETNGAWFEAVIENREIKDSYSVYRDDELDKLILGKVKGAIVFGNGMVMAAYPEPVTGNNIQKRYQSPEEIFDTLHIILDIPEAAFDFSFIFSLLEKLEISLSYSEQDDIDSFRLDAEGLSMRTMMRMAYVIERFTRENAKRLDNLRGVFQTPVFYDEDVLADLSMISYMATYFSPEEIAATDFGAFKLVEQPIKEGEDYIFKFRKENNEYTVRLYKNFDMELISTKSIDTLASNATVLSSDITRDLIRTGGDMIREFYAKLAEHIDNPGDSAYADIDKEFWDIASRFKKEPGILSDEALINERSGVVKIEAREYDEATGECEQIAIAGIPGRYRDSLIKSLRERYPLFVKRAGFRTIEINADGVDKALMLNYINLHLEDILGRAGYKPGPLIDAERTRTVVVADGDGTTYDKSTLTAYPVLYESAARKALIDYLEAGGVYILDTGNEKERTRERILYRDGIPPHLRSRVIIVANGGANLNTISESGEFIEIEDYRLNALGEFKKEKPESLDIVYIGDNHNTEGNDFVAFQKVGSMRAICVSSASLGAIPELLQANYIGGEVIGTSAFLTVVTEEARAFPGQPIFKEDKIPGLIEKARILKRILMRDALSDVLHPSGSSLRESL